MKTKPTRVRNRLALHPLLHKGGAHVPTRGAQRLADRRDLRDELDRWESDPAAEENAPFTTRGPFVKKGPSLTAGAPAH